MDSIGDHISDDNDNVAVNQREMTRNYENQGQGFNLKENNLEEIDDNRENIMIKPKFKSLKTVGLYLCFFALGISVSIFGPALIDFQKMFNVGKKKISLAISSQAFGYLSGSVASSIIYDRINSEVWFFIAATLMLFATSATPMIPNIYVFLFLNFLGGISMGQIDAGGQSNLVSLWKGSKFLEPVFQGLHATWSVGAAIGPLIIKPFLSNSMLSDINSNITFQNETNINSTIPLFYAGLAASVLTIPSIFIYLILYFMMNESFWKKVERNSNLDRKRNFDGLEINSSEFKIVKKNRFIVLCLLAIFYFCYLVTEDTPNHFFPSYVVEGLKWPKSRGPEISSVLFGAHAIGRFVAIPVSFYLRPKSTLIITLSLTSMSLLVIVIFSAFHPAVMWAFTIFLGFGMSSTFASMILRASKWLTMDGTASGIILIGSSLGNIIGPAIVGFLFESVSPKSVPIAAFIGSIFSIIIYISLEMLAKVNKKVNKKSFAMRKFNVPLIKIEYVNGNEVSEDVNSSIGELKCQEK